MRRAYSYVRFSHPDQIKGDSLRRQLAMTTAYCERHKLTLDESLRLVDKGKSAYDGGNIENGAFARFVEAVKSGRVARGSVLILERLDRFSRAQVGWALRKFMDLLDAGIEIVTVEPERQYTQKALNDIPALLEVVISFALAHEESEKKSSRLGHAWEAKRQRIRERPLTKRVPAWLRLVDGKFVVQKRAADVIRSVFARCVNGKGLDWIARELNRQGVEPIGRADFWHFSYLKKIIRGRAVLGEYQPHKKVNGKRVPVGEPIPDYYPAIVAEDLYYQAQEALDGRRHRQRGPTGAGVANLFTGLLRDAHTGSSMTIVAKGRKNTDRQLVSSAAKRGAAGSTYVAFDYGAFELAFLRHFAELRPADLLPRKADPTEQEIAERRGRVTDLDHRIAEANRAGLTGDVSAVVGLLQSLKAERDREAELLDQAKRRQSRVSHSETLGEIKSLVALLDQAGAEDREALRLKIRARVAELVETIYTATWEVPGARVNRRVCLVQIHFAGGMIRWYAVIRRRRGPWLAVGSTDPWTALPKDIDLRRGVPSWEKARDRLRVCLEQSECVSMAVAAGKVDTTDFEWLMGRLAGREA